MRATVASALVCVVALLAGCASANRPYPHCCYQGATTVARLGDLKITLRDGRAVDFKSVFAGFAPRDGLIHPALPFDEVLSVEFIYQSLIPLLPIYDANNDGRLELPEVVVLYVREAALATGADVAHLGLPPGIWALDTANADIGAMVRWVAMNRGAMTPQGQQIFTDLERLGLDLRQRGSENDGDQEIFVL